MNPNKTIAALLLVAMAGVTAVVWSEYVRTEKAQEFSRNCSQNKGIAVLDLDEKMRCVPMFSAKVKP